MLAGSAAIAQGQFERKRISGIDYLRTIQREWQESGDFIGSLYANRPLAVDSATFAPHDRELRDERPVADSVPSPTDQATCN
jgi:hypothetical protein